MTSEEKDSLKVAKDLMSRKGLWVAYVTREMVKWDRMGLKEKRMTWGEMSPTERYSVLSLMDAEEAEIWHILLGM
jgi:predicted Fe-S protein YdhL (DUF1289 family)